MSVHCEYIDVSSAVLVYTDERCIDFAEAPTEQDVMLIRYDEAVVLTGGLDELRSFFLTGLQLLQAPPDRYDSDLQTCRQCHDEVHSVSTEGLCDSCSGMIEAVHREREARRVEKLRQADASNSDPAGIIANARKLWEVEGFHVMRHEEYLRALVEISTKSLALGDDLADYIKALINGG